MKSTEYALPDAPSGWRGVGRPLFVAVVGDENLYKLTAGVGIEVMHLQTPSALQRMQDQLEPGGVDAVVVAYEPWPGVDGVTLARDLRRRCLGTVVVADTSHQFLIEERLAVVPISAMGGVRKQDVIAAVAVAAQETWALAPMRDPFSLDDPTQPGAPPNVTAAVSTSQVLAVEETVRRALPPPPPPPTGSNVRQSQEGYATESTMIELFGEEFVNPSQAPGLLAPDLPAPSKSPSWAQTSTKQWAPDAGMLADLAMAAEVGGDPVEGEVTTSPDRPARLPEPTPTVEADPTPLPVLRPASRGYLFAIMLLGVLVGLLLMALVLRS